MWVGIIFGSLERRKLQKFYFYNEFSELSSIISKVVSRMKKTITTWTMSAFVHAQGKKTVHAGSQKMANAVHVELYRP
mgnify:CR=1 FL=1